MFFFKIFSFFAHKFTREFFVVFQFYSGLASAMRNDITIMSGNNYTLEKVRISFEYIKDFFSFKSTWVHLNEDEGFKFKLK